MCSSDLITDIFLKKHRFSTGMRNDRNREISLCNIGHRQAYVAAYVRRERMMKAASLLERGARVADVAVSVGYANPSKFAAAFKRERGTSPSDYRRCNPQS